MAVVAGCCIQGDLELDGTHSKGSTRCLDGLLCIYADKRKRQMVYVKLGTTLQICVVGNGLHQHRVRWVETRGLRQPQRTVTHGNGSNLQARQIQKHQYRSMKF